MSVRTWLRALFRLGPRDDAAAARDAFDRRVEILYTGVLASYPRARLTCGIVDGAMLVSSLDTPPTDPTYDALDTLARRARAAGLVVEERAAGLRLSPGVRP